MTQAEQMLAERDDLEEELRQLYVSNSTTEERMELVIEITRLKSRYEKLTGKAMCKGDD